MSNQDNNIEVKVNAAKYFIDEIIKPCLWFVHDRMLNNTTYFVIIYTIAIWLNGVYGYNLDTSAILMGYGAIAAKGLTTHTINSALNSDKGVMPKKTGNYQELKDAAEKK